MFAILHFCHIQIFCLSERICPSGTVLTQKFTVSLHCVYVCVCMPGLLIAVCSSAHSFLDHECACVYLWHSYDPHAERFAQRFFGWRVCGCGGLSQLFRQCECVQSYLKNAPCSLVHAGALLKTSASSLLPRENGAKVQEIGGKKHLNALNMLMHVGVCICVYVSVTLLCTSSVAPTQNE